MVEALYLSGDTFGQCSRLKRILSELSIADPENINIKTAKAKLEKSNTGVVFGVDEFTNIVAMTVEIMQRIPVEKSMVVYSYLFAIITESSKGNPKMTGNIVRNVLLERNEVNKGDPFVMARAVVRPLIA